MTAESTHAHAAVPRCLTSGGCMQGDWLVETRSMDMTGSSVATIGVSETGDLHVKDRAITTKATNENFFTA
jgi:hypothetical protein